MAGSVVNTASRGSFPALRDALSGLSMGVEDCPLISFSPPPDWTPLDEALDRLTSYGALAFTSPRAAEVVADRVALHQTQILDGRSLPAVWAGGTATARALRDVLGPPRLPDVLEGWQGGAAETLAAAMLAAQVRGPVLFPCGDTRRQALPERLRGEGIEVDEVVCYRSVLAAETAARDAAAAATVLVVASPSVARLLSRACPAHARPALVAVGPTTAAAARASGWFPLAVASEPTTDAVAAAIRTMLGWRAS